MIATAIETESANVAIEIATAQARPARLELRKQAEGLETTATHTPIAHVLLLPNETLVATHHLLHPEIATVAVLRLRIRAMRDIAAIALQDMMIGMMSVIGGGMIGTAEIGTGIETGIGMVDTVRVVAAMLPEVGKAEEGRHKGYNLQGHQGRIGRKEAQAEDGRDRRARQHSQRIAIETRFGRCSERWTRTVSYADGQHIWQEKNI